jgi:hypothetical protein
MGLLGTIGDVVGAAFGYPGAGTAAESVFGGSDKADSVLGSVADFGASAWSASKQRDFNASQAQLSRDSQIELANTQYQRTVQDLNAAGLSPMLAYSKGATSMPSAAVASSGANVSSDFSGAIKRGQENALMKEQMEVAKSQYQLNVASAQKVAADAAKTALEVEQMPTRFYYDLAEIGSRINSNSAGAAKTVIDARNSANLDAPGTPSVTRELLKGWRNLGSNLEARKNEFFGNLRNPGRIGIRP